MFKTLQNVAKHSLIYGLGDLATRLISFVLIPFYTHYLTAANYGVLELLDLTSYVFGILLAMGFSEAVTRFYFEYKDNEQRERVITTALIGVWCTCLIALPVLLLLAPRFSGIVLEDAGYARFFQLMFMTLALNLSNEIPLCWIRIQQKSLLFSAYSFCTATLTLVLNIVFLSQLGLGLQGVLLSGLITNSAGCIFLTGYTLKRLKLVFSWHDFKRMFAYGWPLIGSWLGGFVLHFADRFVLQRFSNLAEVGVYALAYKFGFLLNVILLTPFRRTWGPKQFEVAAEENAPQTFAAILTYYCLLQTYFALGIAVLIRDVILLITGEQFHAAYKYVPILLAGYSFYGIFVFLEFALLYRKKTKYLAYATLTAGAVNIAANAGLVPIFGAWGAAWATFLSFLYLMLVVWYLAQRLYYIPIEYGRAAKAILCALVMYAAISAINPESAVLSILIKGGLAALFPLVLVPLGFYLPEEKARIAQLWSAGMGLLRRQRGQAD